MLLIFIQVGSYTQFWALLSCFWPFSEANLWATLTRARGTSKWMKKSYGKAMCEIDF